ncbi:ATP-binding cassette domain-containing protein [Streptomyces sp. JJ66]|uniref:ATP-binding cassette domain-containing protein n=1 Tax=Streptomyces sp. JJ66 TaxID=2803843 RepID=UPI001C56BBF4|nr:ATP-binding cassette domain-containing protein [Streptomyces sp. JJ66]MBW1600827.1 ATP-binding cassette domain-containing protein [Streptomyces sp. JJ66]
MIQAIGLTSDPRRGRLPAVDDLTFEARPGRITTLLGPAGAGKSTALRLMLQLQSGRGVALFRGRPLRQMPLPVREVGVLLGDVPGHPGRTARGHLRMLAAAAGVPTSRADELLDVVGLSGLAEQRLGAFSLGMDRRLGLAAALLGDPHTLVLDDPGHGLTPREAAWLYNLLRGYAQQGGLVLATTRDPKEAARLADRVVTLEDGRLRADQEVTAFARTRLRPRVAVTTPHARRLAAVLTQEARSAARAELFAVARQTSAVDSRRSNSAGGPDGEATAVEVVQENGGRVCVYNSTCAMVGETAYRHGILVHRLADEVGDCADPPVPLDRADGHTPPAPRTPKDAVSQTGQVTATETGATPVRPAGNWPRLPAVPPAGPCRPLRYEWHRMVGVRSGWLIAAVALAGGLVAALVLGYGGGEPARVRALTGWPEQLPLPPLAAAAGLLGALAFGQEFRYPALAPAQVPVPRRLGLLLAKLTVTTCATVLLTVTTAALNGAVLTVFYGSGFLGLPPHWGLGLAATGALAVGCAWAGVLAAAVFRSTLLGTAAVLAVPLGVAPAVRAVLARSGEGAVGALAQRLEPYFLVRWPGGAEEWAPTAARMVSQPVSGALAVSLAVLFCACACTRLRSRARWTGLAGAADQRQSHTVR